VNYHTLIFGTVWASQFNGHRRQDSIVRLVLHPLQGQESWFPRPKSLYGHIPISLVFACGIGAQHMAIISKILHLCSFPHAMPAFRSRSVPGGNMLRLVGFGRQAYAFPAERLRERWGFALRQFARLSSRAFTLSGRARSFPPVS
jgi:hypothetical protein